MTKQRLERRGLSARLAVLCLPVAAALVFPSAAMAASGSGSTVRAVVNGDGSVKSVTVYGAGGSSSAFNGTMPLKLSIGRSVSGSTSTYTYEVQNTFSKTQDVTYTDTAGKTHTSSQTLQLPLVAQLGIQLPNSFKNVSTSNGVVLIDPDGTTRVLFDLVLFAPLGSPTQSVSFTATGSGVPTAELSAAAVNPSTTGGLSQASQDATASSQQDDFWAGFAGGGNGGLTQLVAGMGQLISGLQQLAPGAHQLADGIKAAGAGAIKLDAGTKSAFDGSKKIAAGTKSAHSGSSTLSSGIGEIHAGNVSLASGLQLIKGGLAELDGKTAGNAGVEGAVVGITAIEKGLKQVLIGLQGFNGSVTAPTDADPTTNPPTPSVLKGLAEVKGGVDLVSTPLWNDLLALKALTTPPTAASPNPKFDLAFASQLNPASPTFDAALAAWVQQLGTDLGTAALPAGVDPTHPAGGALAQSSAGLAGLIAGVGKITIGLNSHTPGTFGSTDAGGIDYGLLALLDPKAGLPAAVSGIDQLYTGSVSAASGATKLASGSGDAFTGSKELSAGLGELQTGTSSLTSGLGQLSAGQHESATGLPAAVSGSGQIATGVDQLLAGADKVKAGIAGVQSQAVAPLNAQLLTGSQNAKKQLAILAAAAALGDQAPGGAGTAYVLSQSPNGLRLAASSSAAKSSDNTGRNVGIGLGGFAALVIAVGAGFAIGRRSRATV